MKREDEIVSDQLKEKFPKIYSIERIMSDTLVQAYAGDHSGVTISFEPASYGEYGTTHQFRYSARARSQRDLVRCIEMTIYELETMRREAMKADFDSVDGLSLEGTIR